MQDRFHFFIGSFEWGLFPSFALFLGAAGFTATRAVSLPVSISILAVCFPIGYWVIGLYRVSGLKSERQLAEAYLDIARGAQVASYAVFIACIPFAIIVAMVYDQFLIGLGFLFVSLGSIWIPTAYSAAARAKLLALEGGHEEFFKSLGDQSHNAQKIAILFLALMTGNRLMLQRMFPTLIYILFLVALYLKGWLMIGAAGTYPAILVGLIAPLILLSRSFLSIRRMTLQQKQGVSDTLFNKIPSITLVGGRLGMISLSVLAVLIIVFILRI